MGNVCSACHVSIQMFLAVKARGELNEKVAPRFPWSLFWAHILSPCASIIFLEIYNPSPVPLKDDRH